VVCLATLLAQTRSAPRSLFAEPILLTESAPTVELAVSDKIRTIVIDSYLSNSEDLATGTEVGRIVLSPERPGWSGVLRAGVETGEWAARRPGLELTARPPDPQISWLAPRSPGPGYFAQRYRAAFDLGDSSAVASLRIERSKGLDPEIELAVFQLGVSH
jgi:hypothetical protein